MAKESRAIVVLIPAESKRLIAIAVATLPQVRSALRRGRIIISGGTTNAYVAEELTKKKIDKFWYTAGRVTAGMLGANDPAKRINPIVLINGKVVDRKPCEVLEEFTSDDVFLKGANAIDPYGNAGVLMSSRTGGTIGTAIGIVMARGAHLIIPVGLEKLVPSVVEASMACGQNRFDHSTGDRVGMMPLVGANTVTETRALDILFGVKGVHVASGGVVGSEGAVVISLEGTKKGVREAFDFISKKIKGEPPLATEAI